MLRLESLECEIKENLMASPYFMCRRVAARRARSMLTAASFATALVLGACGDDSSTGGADAGITAEADATITDTDEQTDAQDTDATETDAAETDAPTDVGTDAQTDTASDDGPDAGITDDGGVDHEPPEERAEATGEDADAVPDPRPTTGSLRRRRR